MTAEHKPQSVGAESTAGSMSAPSKPQREQENWPQQFDPAHPEKGWHPAEPWQGRTSYRHWPWLQRIVDWLWRVKR